MIHLSYQPIWLTIFRRETERETDMECIFFTAHKYVCPSETTLIFLNTKIDVRTWKKWIQKSGKHQLIFKWMLPLFRFHFSVGNSWPVTWFQSVYGHIFIFQKWNQKTFIFGHNHRSLGPFGFYFDTFHHEIQLLSRFFLEMFRSLKITKTAIFIKMIVFIGMKLKPHLCHKCT